MSDIHTELEETFESYQQLLRIDRHLHQLNDQLQNSYRDLDRLETQLRKEFSDIEELEKLSVKGLFHKVLGSKEEQIEKERQEYLQVSLKYNEAKKSVELLEYERDLLQGKTKDLSTLEKKLDSLIKQREKLLIEANTPVGKQILDLLLVEDANREFIGDIKQVKKAGDEVLLILDKMTDHLRQAKNWGQWDMAGRQRGSSYLKHNQIDQARDLSYHAKHLLVRLERDLSQIYGNEQFNLSFKLDSFSKFTDIFFDDLISDWIVQQKIQNALSNVITVRDKLIGILQSLDVEIGKADKKLIQLEEQRKQLIIQS
ncbi:MAG: hypothetical protein IPL46_31935 [Saprospiraceae bacterium]|nr:hypothetical protein [Saprospiraceae bacterium]